MALSTEPEPYPTEPTPAHEPTRVETALLKKWQEEGTADLSPREVARRRVRDCYDAIEGKSVTEEGSR